MVTFEEIRQHNIFKSVAFQGAIAFIGNLTARERDTIWKSGTDIDEFVKQKFDYYLKLLEG